MKLRVRFNGLLSAAGVLICLAVLVSFAGSRWWVLELATHFRVQYALALGLFVVIFSWMRQWWWAAIFGAFALLNTVVTVPAFWGENLTVQAAYDKLPVLRALLANVNFDNQEDERIRRMILESDPDLILLLETTPWLMSQLRDLNERYPYQVAEPRDDPFGIAILSRYPFSSTRFTPLSVSGPPAIVAVFSFTDGRPLTLMGIHTWPPINAAFAQGRNEQLHNLANWARQTTSPLLILGDLNISPWSPWFVRLLADSGLHDSLRGRGFQPSWPVGWPLFWTPLDHVLFSDGIHIVRREVGPAIGSDHYPIIVEFQIIGP